MPVTDVNSCVEYNELNTTTEELEHIAFIIGARPFTVWSETEVKALAVWQGKMGLEDDGAYGPKTRSRLERNLLARFNDKEFFIPDHAKYVGILTKADSFVPFTEEEKLKVCSWTFVHESGRGVAAYSAINVDGEYLGKFDRPKDLPIEDRTNRHPASKYNPSGGFHIGISFGRIQHTQDGGSLGKVLTRCNELDRTRFVKWAGSAAIADELLRVTNAPGGKRVNGRSPRCQPVNGKDLWDDVWVRKFKLLGATPYCQKAQDERMINSYLAPVILACKEVGIERHSIIAVLFDICVQCGKAGFRRYFDRAMRGVRVRDGGMPNDALRVIEQLPANLRDRRRNILKAAPQNIRYIL